MARHSLALVGMVTAMMLSADEITLFDFTTGTHGWQGNPRITKLASTPEGLAFACDGQEDPWIEGPPVTTDLSAASVRVTLRLRTNGDAGGELFYGPRFEGGKSVGVPLETDGQWHDYTVVIPPQPKGTRFRFDPGQHGGTDLVLQSIRAQVLVPMPAPSTDPPQIRPCTGLELVAGDLRLRHAADRWGQFEVTVAGQSFARSYGNDQIGYLRDQEAAFLKLADTSCAVTLEGEAIIAHLGIADADGVNWRLERRFAVGGNGAISVTTTVAVARKRETFHLPLLTLFPGLGSFGERKTQAVLAGVEYLADEPSSSEADVRGPLANRKIVDDVKLCFPFMAVVHAGHWLGVAWTRQDHPAALFDSPDRTFGSGAHLLGLWYPAVGSRRLENSVAALDAMPLLPDEPLVFHYEILAGSGDTAVAPVQAYVARHPLPPVPENTGGYGAAMDLLAHGWLDSASNQGGIWRHAVWGKNFPPQPAADAVCFQRWLAGQTEDAGLAQRLRESADQGLAKTKDNLSSGVSHVRFAPLPYLLEGGIEARITQAVAGARQALARFDENGVLTYHPREDHPDYSSTHFAKHANGLAAPVAKQVLEACLLSGDPDLRRDALALVDRLTALYAGTVPRGAQTWECPLHTPDILASAHLVSLYTMAYQISGEEKYLEQARYWAWTGVPFVYLDPPVEKPVGTYATIAVLGATNWQAPFWIGRPVQWCGLVYGAGLANLAKVDHANAALWRQLASGITVTGVQMSWPTSDHDRQGLLPDFYHLLAQRSDGPAINPGTVGSHLPDAFGKGRIYDCQVLGPQRLLVHAPGDLQVVDGSTVQLAAWPTVPYRVLVVGVDAKPTIAWNGHAVEVDYLPAHRAAMVLLSGPGSLTIR